MKSILYLGLTIILLAKFICADEITPYSQCPYSSEGYTRYSYEGNYSKYWECFEGQKTLRDCPVGFEFNADSQVCDFPETAKHNSSSNSDLGVVSSSTSTSTSTVTSSTTTSTVTTSTSTGTVTTRRSTSTVTSRTTTQTTTKTPTSSSTTSTDSSTSTTTSETTVITTPNTSNWTSDALFLFPSDNLVLTSHPTNCSLFWEFHQGIKYLITCPAGLVFNDVTGYCDSPANVDCSRNSTLEITELTTTSTKPAITETTKTTSRKVRTLTTPTNSTTSG